MIKWPFNPGSLFDIINRILPIVYSVAGIILFGLIIYGGFMWLTSAGDPDKVRKAVNTIVNAVIGVAIIIFAYFATRVVSGILGYPLI
jgi:TRAP-type C4-dicarboxylate transport system permease small subunit